MAQPRKKSEQAFGSDSFLDIVANLMGILIILVIIAGLRARSIPEELVNSAQDIAQEIRMLAGRGSNIEHETLRLNREVESVQRVQTELEDEQTQLAAVRQQLQEELDRRRAELDDKSQSDFDGRRKLASAEARLSRLDEELALAAQTQPRVAKKIENYPTPLSKTVAGKELHFQLRDGRITYVPLDELVDLFRSEVRARASQLRQRDSAVDTIGPVGGFRMRFVLERVEMPVQVGSSGVMAASFARLEEFTLIPVDPDMGETLQEAMGTGSEFRRRVADKPPERTTVTLWTYPDSFQLYREIRKTLYFQGFTVAGRPLPEGQPIGGSPQGTKSAAQ